MSLSFDSTGRVRRPGAFVPDDERWTAEHITRAKVLHKEGLSAASVARVLTEEFGIYRTGNGVRGLLDRQRKNSEAPVDRASAARIAAARVKAERTKRKAAMKNRECRMCLKPFPSEWEGNWVCSPCKSTEAWR